MARRAAPPAAPKAPGGHATASCAPRGPGAPARLGAPGGGAGRRAQPPSHSRAAPSPEQRASSPPARGQGCGAPLAPSPPAPPRLQLKPGEAACARAKPSMAPARPLGMLHRSKRTGAVGSWGRRAPRKPPAPRGCS